MTLYLLALTMLCAVSVATEPMPIVVVIERNPWLSVIGSDSPTFALYDDGTVIYLRDKTWSEEPFHSRKVADAKKTANEILSFDLIKAKDYYRLADVTDQVLTIIWTPSKKIAIYGNWRKAPEMRGGTDPKRKALDEQEKQMWESLPGEIRESLLRIDEQRKLQGSAWLPKKIEVMFWPYEYAPDESIIWPKEWPGLSAKDTRKKGEDLYIVCLPSEKYPDLRRLLATRKEKGAVLIDGKKMAEDYRFPFPGEAEWMKRKK